MMFHLSVILIGVLASPMVRVGGEAGFKEHLESLEAQYADAPSPNQAYRLAVGYASRGKMQQTQDWLLKAERLGVDKDRIELCLAEAHLNLGDHESAIRNYFEVANRTPTHFGAMRGLWVARIHARKLSGNLDLDRIDALLEKSGFPVIKIEEKMAPQKAAKLRYRAKQDLKTGRLGSAERNLRSAIQQHWLASDSYRLLSKLWHIRGDERRSHGSISIYLEFAWRPDQLYRRALRTWMDTERRGKLGQ